MDTSPSGPAASSATSTLDPSGAGSTAPVPEQSNLRRTMESRHLVMIALGGVIGSGLFVSSGYTISQAMFQRLLAESALFREFIFRYFAERVTDLMQLVEEIAFGGMDQRLANYLLERGPQIETTHQVIADELGTVREVVSRRLKQLEARKLVRLERGQIVLLDAPGLRRLAGPLRDSSH